MRKDQKEVFEEAKSVLTEYLSAQEYRKTQGRFDILKEIYSMDSHFEVETLYLMLKNKSYHISRATIYNTIDILLDCGLITKHDFGTKAGTYEKAYGSVRHDHLISLPTQEVIEFEEPALKEIIRKLGEKFDHEITHYSFTLYGLPKEKN